MIMVDSSVWADFLNGAPTRQAEELARLLEDRAVPIVTLPIVVAEVLQGLKTEARFRHVAALLTRLPRLPETIDTYVAAAQLFRILRKAGVTVRGTIDCLIAQVCIENRASLLCKDRDFDFIARHSPLVLVQG
jgi:predicted nucleic acid-binding protein